MSRLTFWRENSINLSFWSSLKSQISSTERIHQVLEIYFLKFEAINLNKAILSEFDSLLSSQKWKVLSKLAKLQFLFGKAKSNLKIYLSSQIYLKFEHHQEYLKHEKGRFHSQNRYSSLRIRNCTGRQNRWRSCRIMIESYCAVRWIHNL